MKLKKWKTKKEGYSIIINKDVEICISHENFKNESRVYFVDYFDDSSDFEEGYNPYLSEVFDCLYLAIEYMQNNFDINKKISNKIKFN